MSLQFIYGRAHSGKTSFVLSKAEEYVKNNIPVIIVVPEQFTHIAERKLISKLGSIQEGIAEVLSFDRIGKRINNDHPGNKQRISAIGKTLIVADIISNTKLSYYKSSSDVGGFIDICNEEISEFKKYMITPDKLNEAADNVTDVSLSMKLRDLASIYEQYEKRISSEFTDADDSLNILAENLEKYNPYNGYVFLFDEFSSFNPQEREIISILSKQASMIYVTLCADNDKKYVSLFRPTLQCADSLRCVCEAQGCKILDNIYLDNTYYMNEDMSFLEKTLYSFEFDEYKKDVENIKIFSCENPYFEVVNLASQISSMIKENNIRYKDINVIVSDIEEYGYIIKSVFDEYNIPFFVDEKTGILKHAIVSFVINILDIYINGYDSESVVNYLKSGCITAGKEDIYIADNYMSAMRVSKNTWLSDERFYASCETYTKGNLKAKKSLEEIRNSHILPLSMFHDKIKGRHTAKYITEKLYTFLTDSRFDVKINEFIKLFKNQGDIKLAKQYESVWNLLMDAFDMMVYILGDRTMNVSEFRSFLYIAFNQQSIGIIPTSLDEVIVGDVMRSKSDSVLYQYVIGAVDGKFPKSGNNESLISDIEKEYLQKSGIELSPSTKEKAYFDRFQIYSALSNPLNGLVISYPNSDSDFSATRQSLIITSLKNIFPKIDIISAQINNCDTINAAYQKLAESAAALQYGEPVNTEWKDIYKFFIDSKDLSSIERIDNILNYKNKTYKLSPDILSEYFGDEFYSTISRIQKYNACQYSYYLTYMLSLKEKKPFGIENVDIGNIIHKIIETVFENIKKKNIQLKDTDNNYFRSEIDTLLQEHISSIIDSGNDISEREIFGIKHLSEMLYNSVVVIKDHIVKSEFVPLGHEIIFDDNNIGCIEFSLNNGKKLKITGKIDRADSFSNEYGTFIRVIDYKTGSKTFNFTNVFYGLDIQLLVYLNALVDKTPKGNAAGALFFKIQAPVSTSDQRPVENSDIQSEIKPVKMEGIISDDPKVIAAYSPDSINTKNKLSSKQIHMLSEYVNSTVQKSAENLSDGYININPYVHSSSSSCDYCAYSSICNFSNGKNGTFRMLNTISSKNMFEELSETESEREE